MPITQAQLLESIRSAYNKVLQYAKGDSEQQPGNLSILQLRSFEWVRLLALELQQLWKQQERVVTHFKQLGKHAPSTAGELLTDIHIVQTSEVLSMQKGTSIPFATRSLLAVESEFAHDSRELLYDLGKLFMVRAPWLIFVSSRAGRKSDLDAWKRQLRMYEDAANGGLPGDATLLIVVISDPAEWLDPAAERELQIYRYSVASQSLEQAS